MESVKSNGTEQVVKSSSLSSWQSNLQEAAMEELNRGQKQAERLLLLLKGVLSSPESRPAAELLVDVGAAFAKALTFMELKKDESESDKAPINSEGMSSCSHEQIKRKFQTSRRRSCRRRAHPYSCTTIFSTKIEDGHGWRKYGQKGIYGSKHPRSYYRCVHKHDRGCPVTRQVQRTEEDDSIFAITYVGQHTCMEDDHTTAATDLQALTLESKMNKNDDASDDDDKELAAPPSAMKRDCEEEMISIESTTAGSCSSSEISSTFSGLAPLSAEDGNYSSANLGFGMGFDELIALMSAH
ncbi:probable WRKY transcription factor 70 [Zingiber officinale]|uniref:WRKY domain-containing protein n=1 Tax=Zingiber officinale TaxID=94328 RepID=A0A8J5LEE1_ZINOF|nr:probable WRKY transcription factor 70 [Zingiber officinale]KAG6509818.1 hypothetical protein ZIOFF_027825 [Zingiber officinale]